MKKTLLALGLAATFAVSAGGKPPAPIESKETSSWHYGIGLGFTNYDGMILNDGQTVLGRLSIAKDVKRTAIALKFKQLVRHLIIWLDNDYPNRPLIVLL